MNSDLLKNVGVDVLSDALLSRYTTFQLGGPCSCVITCKTPEQLQRIVQGLSHDQNSFVVMGSGSNILVSDQGFQGTILRYVGDDPFITQRDDEVDVWGSTLLDDFAKYTSEQGLDGLMCCTGIPGTVGGGLVGNAGAWGEQIADLLVTVSLMDRSGETREVAPETLGFMYRSSFLQECDDIVVSAKFKLSKRDRYMLLEKRQEILQMRAEKHPDLQENPCIGSFFRNIEPTSKAGRRQAAGWFLNQVGAKKMCVGGACVFSKHANIIIKSKGCTAQDVYDLALKMKREVKEKFNLDLIREVRLLGVFDGEQNRSFSCFY
ncbi:MAG: UDP-N-acetylmuramate dehydrogenase [Kiritimatiellae bacterium]|nr:UDP-N-acetylmuramate dehydrogenase [Kiritimatiellia bacterium]